MWLAYNVFSRWIYPAGSSSRKDGLDHDSCAPPSYDAKAKSLPIVGQLNHLHVTPLTWQRLEEKDEREKRAKGQEKSILINSLKKKSNSNNRLVLNGLDSLVCLHPQTSLTMTPHLHDNYLMSNGGQVSPHRHGAGDSRGSAVLKNMNAMCEIKENHKWHGVSWAIVSNVTSGILKYIYYFGGGWWVL